MIGDIDKDYVIICKQRVDRPRTVSVSQWLAQWEYSVQGHKALDAAYERGMEDAESHASDAYEDGYRDGSEGR